jgi:hypothetical protein
MARTYANEFGGTINEFPDADACARHYRFGEYAHRHLVITTYADGHVVRRESDTLTDAKAFAAYQSAQHPDAVSVEVSCPGEPIVTFAAKEGATS